MWPKLKQGAGARFGFLAVKKILADGEVGEQRQVLRHVTHFAEARRDQRFLGGVGQDAVVQLNEGGGGAAQSGDQIKQGGLARP